MDSKENLYSPKCLCGRVSVVKACSVFSVINAVIVGLIILGCLVSLALVASKYASTSSHGYPPTMDVNQLAELLRVILITAAVYVGSVVCAIFAFVLLYGMRKKQAVFVQAYLIYGIIVEVALIISTFVYIGLKSQRLNNETGVKFFAIYSTLAVCVCILYGYILRIVYVTYIVLLNAQSNTADAQSLCMAEIEGSQLGTTIPTAPPLDPPKSEAEYPLARPLGEKPYTPAVTIPPY